jgi:hypothetical protein
MNIFVLSTDPIQAAVYQCNKHVVKMIVETAQLLSSAHSKDIAPYKHTHTNHPCAKWSRASLDNYRWLARHGIALCTEYTKRYSKIHKTQAVLIWLRDNEPKIESVGMTPFAIAIKNTDYHNSDPVKAYQAYYIGDKKRFAKWAPRAKPPTWWPFKEDSYE